LPLRDTRAKLTVAVRVAGTSLTGLFGVGPVIAVPVIGDVRDLCSQCPRACPSAPDGDHKAWSTLPLVPARVAAVRRGHLDVAARAVVNADTGDLQAGCAGIRGYLPMGAGGC